jgi:hypothetical protein
MGYEEWQSDSKMFGQSKMHAFNQSWEKWGVGKILEGVRQILFADITSEIFTIYHKGDIV